jgi:zinc/manganese transport system permease protein
MTTLLLNPFQFAFMRSAFMSGTAVALIAGLTGYFVILRRQIFASDTLSHIAFAGAMAAALIGLNPLFGLFAVSVVGGLSLSALGQRGRARARDVATGMVMVWMLGLGALFLGIYVTSATTNANIAIGVGVLFGSIFGITGSQAVVIVLVGMATCLVLLAVTRPLLFASLDPEAAVARGMPTRFLGGLFMVLLGIAVAEAVPTVGALLIFALLITPAAIAQRLVKRPYAALFLSALLAVVFTWSGLLIAFYLPFPVSFVISTLAFAVYLGVITSQRLLTHRRVGGGPGRSRDVLQPALREKRPATPGVSSP